MREQTPLDATLRRHRTGAYVLAFVCMGLSVGFIGPLLPFLKARTHANAGSMSAWFVCRGIGGFAGALVGGAALDRMPGHRVVTASLLLLALVVACIPAATTPAGLAVLFLLFDLAVGGLQSCNALMCWTWAAPSGGEKLATSALNGLNAAFGVGTLVAPLLPVAVGDAHWAWTPRIVTAVVLPCAAFVWSVPSPAHVETHDATVKAFEAAPPRALVVCLTAIFLALVVGAETTLGAFLVLYTDSLPKRNGDISVPTASHAEGDVLTTAFWIAFTAGRLLMGAASARARPRTVLGAELVVLCVSVTILVASPPQSRASLWIGVIGCGLGLSGCFGGAVGQAGELTPLTGRVNGVFGAGAVAGVSLVQLTAAISAARWGNHAILSTVAAASFVAAAVMVALWRLAPAPVAAGQGDHVPLTSDFDGGTKEMEELQETGTPRG